MSRAARYVDLAGPTLGSPAALGRFRVRTRWDALMDPWSVFLFGAAAVGVLLGIEWLRALIAGMGPD